MRASIRFACGVTATFVVLVRAEVDARADSAFINPGFIATAVGGNHTSSAIGGELSFMYYSGREKVQDQIGIGAFLQAQRYGGDHNRYALGVQAGSLLGVELGWAYRESSPDQSFTTGPHMAIFGSTGFVVGFVRTTIPVVHGSSPTHGFEIALGFALKIPIPLGDPDFVGHLPSGRPLRRDDGGAIVASAELGDAWSRDGATGEIDIGDLDAKHRAEIARAWLDDARMEHASVAAFSSLSLDLLATGAPPELVARAHRAAADEVRHARALFAIASAYAGEPLTAGPLALSNHGRTGDLARMAALAFVDGCVGEAAAAEHARRGHACAKVPAVREALATIAREENEHAELAWDVLEWCIGCGGEPVARAVAAAIENAPEELHVAPLEAPAELLAAHGRLSAGHAALSYATARAAAVARARALARG